MIGGSDVLWGGIVPGVVAAATFALVWRVTGKAASAWRTALVLGYVVGHWTLDARDIGAARLNVSLQAEASEIDWAYDFRNFEFRAALIKSFQPTEARDWLPLVALLAIVPDAIACVGKFGPAIGWLLRVGLCVLLPWRLLYGSAYLPLPISPDFDFDLGGWSTGEATAWIGGIGAALLLAWQLLRVRNPQESPLLSATLATVVALGAAVTMALSDSIALGQRFGVLVAALAGCALASALAKTERGPDAAAGPLLVMFGSLLVIGHFFAGLKLGNAASLLVAMALAAGWLPLPTQLAPRWRTAVRTLACFVAIAIPAAIAQLDFAATQQPPQDGIEAEVNPYESFSP